MKNRIRIPVDIFFALVLIVAGLAFINPPRVMYTYRAFKAYDHALSLWQSASPSAYTMLAANNSLTQPTGGWNTLTVRDGAVIEGHNPDCPDCTLADFASLTVEALFERIQEQCLRDFPGQFCGVAYDEILGFPRRIDTYPYNRAGIERPSITVQSVEILEP